MSSSRWSYLIRLSNRKESQEERNKRVKGAEKLNKTHGRQMACVQRGIYGRGEYLLQRSLLRDCDMDLLRRLRVLSGGVVGVLGDMSWSVNGVLVSLVSLEKIPLFGSHWKYRLPATEPSFFPEVQVRGFTPSELLSGPGCSLNTQCRRRTLPWIGQDRRDGSELGSLPMGSSRTTPAQSPGANLVSPM